jgi:iron(III) transport system permease protein
VPANWSLNNFQAALGDRALAGLVTSIVLALTAATAVVILGAVVAFVARRGRGRVLGSIVALTFVVPGSALAVAMILAYGTVLRDTLGLILVAYLAKFWAIGHRQVAGSIDRLPPELSSAVRASGGGRLDVLRTVIVPGLAPALVAAWLVVFVLGLHELTMSSLLYGPGTATLAVVVLNLQQLGDPGVSSALAVVLTLVVAAAAVPLVSLGRVGERMAGLR